MLVAALHLDEQFLRATAMLEEILVHHEEIGAAPLAFDALAEVEDLAAGREERRVFALEKMARGAEPAGVGTTDAGHQHDAVAA